MPERKKMKLRVKESRLTSGVSVTLRIEKSEAWRYKEIRQVFEQLRELDQMCDVGTWKYLVSELDALIKREREAYSISASLNGSGHESLSEGEVKRLLARHHELRPYSYS
jgi:hypothetical protein